MSRAPRVSVVMPAYDREATLRESIDSVLAQTFRDFELVVIDDGSSDRTAEIADSTGDPRVRVVRNERNLGVTVTRARGLELARGELVANLDSDDLAHPERLARQVAFLDAHPACAMVGTWALRIDRRGRTKGEYRRPVGWRDIRAHLLFRNCFKNTTVTGRREIFRRYGYRTEFEVNEDVDLHVRISLEHEVANLPEWLGSYRRHRGSLSRQQRERTHAAETAINAAQLARLGVEASDDELALHQRLRRARGVRGDPLSEAELEAMDAWLRRLAAANREHALYPEPEFSRVLGARWWSACRHAAEGPRALARFARSPLARFSGRAWAAGARDRLAGRHA